MLSHRLARPLLASMFIAGGIDAVLRPEAKVAKAEFVTDRLARVLGLPDDTKLLIRVNGGIQIGAGMLLAANVLPRPMAATLASSLVPTTLAGHPFWRETDPSTRAAQRIQFLKNASILGGLILAANDTDGKPSVSWRAHRALEHGASRVSDSATRAVHALPLHIGPANA
jgi:putative oxidoreductase